MVLSKWEPLAQNERVGTYTLRPVRMCAVRMVKKVAENFRLFVIETYVIRQISVVY